MKSLILFVCLTSIIARVSGFIRLTRTTSRATTFEATTGIKYGGLHHCGILVRDVGESKSFYMVRALKHIRNTHVLSLTQYTPSTHTFSQDVFGFEDESHMRPTTLPYPGAFLKIGPGTQPNSFTSHLNHPFPNYSPSSNHTWPSVIHDPPIPHDNDNMIMTTTIWQCQRQMTTTTTMTTTVTMTITDQIHLMQLPNPDPTTGRPAHGGRDRHTGVCHTLSSHTLASHTSKSHPTTPSLPSPPPPPPLPFFLI